jgi:hypothetical protein
MGSALEEVIHNLTLGLRPLAATEMIRPDLSRLIVTPSYNATVTLKLRELSL